MSTDVKLDDLVHHFLKGKELSDVERRGLHGVFVNSVEQTIRKKYKTELEKELQEEMLERELHNKIKGSKEVIWIAIVLAFFVGLFCGQVTEYIDWALFNFVPGNFIGVTRLGGCVVIVLAIYFVYESRYIDTIKSYYEKRARND